MVTGRLAPGHDWKRLATVAAVVLGAIVLLVGVAAWVLSLRPLTFRIDPGQVASWRLATTSAELGADGKPGPERTDERTLVLIGLGPANEAALVVEPLRLGEGLSLLRFEDTGTCTLLDPAGRPLDGGKAVGVFDFNLLPLPPGSEQSWWASVSWAAVPPAKRTAQARVRRLRTGATGRHSEFQLKLPGSIEWIENGGYRQFRDVVANWRFAAGRHLPEEAEIRLVAGSETAKAPRRVQVAARLRLADDRDCDDEPARLREAALACAEAQELLRTGGGPRARTVVERLRSVTVNEPRLRALSAALAEALAAARPRPAGDGEAAAQWALVAAAGGDQERERAERLVHLLTAQGFPAWLQAGAGRQLKVLVGPFPARDEAQLQRLVARFPYLRPSWTSVR
ncbi:MAG: SPOR domain-containing protein [Planctomycetes bacterium]|nr:SPOR domain-containing protein [Planctomycetota bacterium]